MPIFSWIRKFIDLYYLTYLLAFYFFCSSSIVSAQQADFLEKTFDFGVVPQGQVLTHDFHFSNKGDGDLIIRKISPACGCLAAVADSAVIHAKGSSYLRVNFDTTGFIGKKIKTIRVYSNDSSNSSQILEIKAEIKPKISAVPESIRFQDLPFGIGAVGEITLSRLEGVEGRIKQAISKSQFISVLYDKNKDNVSLRVKPDTPIGKYHAQISIKLDSKEVPLINVPIYFEVVGNLKFEPAVINFGLVKLDSSEIVKKVKVTSRDGTEISNLKNIEIDSSLITVTQDRVVGSNTLILNVKLRPNSKSIIRAPIKLQFSAEKSDYQLQVFGVIDEE